MKKKAICSPKDGPNGLRMITTRSMVETMFIASEAKREVTNLLHFISLRMIASRRIVSGKRTHEARPIVAKKTAEPKSGGGTKPIPPK
jgi:hypothetical protein